jgi:hypothetical protein
MTYGGTNFFFIKIVTLETGDMAQKVFFLEHQLQATNYSSRMSFSQFMAPRGNLSFSHSLWLPRSSVLSMRLLLVALQ